MCFYLGREDMDSLACSGMEIGALYRPLGYLKALHQYSCLCFVQSLLLYSERVRRRERYAVKHWYYVLKRPHACASCVQAVGAECYFTAVTRLVYSVCRLKLPALRGQRSRLCEAVALLGCGVAHSMVERLSHVGLRLSCAYMDLGLIVASWLPSIIIMMLCWATATWLCSRHDVVHLLGLCVGLGLVCNITRSDTCYVSRCGV